MANPETEDDEPFRFADECHLCGADLRSPELGGRYVLGGIVAIPNDTGGTSAVCVCDVCFRQRRGEDGPDQAARAGIVVQ